MAPWPALQIAADFLHEGAEAFMENDAGAAEHAPQRRAVEVDLRSLRSPVEAVDREEPAPVWLR